LGGEDRHGVLQIQAKELWISARERVPNGLLVLEDGRVRSAGKGTADPSDPLIIHDGVVTAGLIASRAEIGAVGELQDDTRSVLSEARARFTLDWTSTGFERARAEGITAFVLTPGTRNLVGGLTSVVKTFGERISAPDAALALSLSAAALGRSTVQGGFLFGAARGEAPAEIEGGPENSSTTQRGTREPTSYPGAVAMLRHLFESGQGPFARAKTGDLPVTIEAWDRHEVQRAIQFAAERHLRGSIRGAPLAGDPDIVAALKASGLGVVVGPYSAGQAQRSLESVKILSEAGVPVAFALDAPGHAPIELRLTAVRARDAGASTDAVWKALTEDAARLAGVGESAGTLESGRDADVVLWSGNPLDLSSRVVAVYVDGERAWPAETH
jgi:imidazolonepropionase-like amidohydrolase